MAVLITVRILLPVDHNNSADPKSCGLFLGGELGGNVLDGEVSSVEGLLEFVVGRSPVLEFKDVLNCVFAVESRSHLGAEAVSGEADFFSSVLVLYVGNGSRPCVDSCLGVSVILGIEGQSVELSLDVVPDDSHLRKSTIEGFGGRHIKDVTDTEDVAILFVLESVLVNVEVSC